VIDTIAAVGRDEVPHEVLQDLVSRDVLPEVAEHEDIPPSDETADDDDDDDRNEIPDAPLMLLQPIQKMKMSRMG